MKSVRFLGAARRELLAEVLHYNELEPGLGSRFARAFEQALALAVRFPPAGSSGPAETRKIVLKGFPFSIYYLEEIDAFLVVAVSQKGLRKAALGYSRGLDQEGNAF